MQYDLQIEEVSSIRRRLRFTLASGLVKVELDRAFVTYKNKVRIPGFRSGKVPRPMLEQRFGKQIQAEVAESLVNRLYREASEKLEVASQPQLTRPGEVLQGSDFTFEVEVDVKPHVAIHGYKGVEVEYAEATVTDADVERVVKQRLATKTHIESVEDGRGVQKGDLVLTELKLLGADGAELANEAGTMVSTGGEKYYPGVEALLVGLSKGEGATAEVTIRSSSVFNHLRGVTATATVKVLEIQAQVIPALSDEIALELGFEGGVDGMRTAIRMQLQDQADEAGRMQARVALLQKLVDNHDFDVPNTMVDEQLQALVEELRVRRAWGGTDPRSIRFSDAEMADLRVRARFAAKGSVILATVAKAESLDVSDDDISAKINEIADSRGQAPEAIRGYLERENALPVLRDRILEEKTLEWLLENASLTVRGASAHSAQVEAAAEAPVEPAGELAVEPAADEPAAEQAAPSEG